MATPVQKLGFHPRNRHQGRYDFQALVRTSPELAPRVRKNPSGEPTIEFANPVAVRALNRALLRHFYSLTEWDLPEGYLCPPVPGRADYVHHIADLLAAGGAIPRGPATRVLDVGVGASLIYPIIGHGEYGWSFVGSEIDAAALASAKKIAEADPKLANAVELRLQTSPKNVLKGIVRETDAFDAVICNPPFHASLEEAREGSLRKWRGLGFRPKPRTPLLNFGGKDTELWCPGGEAAFVSRMIEESVGFAKQVRWFTTLVSKEPNLRTVAAALKKAGAREDRVIEMAQGQKRTRVVAWRFAP